ncbi:unnamed protein product [marine sediment metagenome]|uniref:Uncharacterized protein n=1 Tax=marine sediment metagenome TaxID=412755 RepID=X1D9R2_9ZZZZ
MARGSLYPFKIRIKEPDLIPLYKLLSERRAVRIPDKQTSIKIGCKLSPIRQDVFLGPDSKYRRSFLSLPPELDLIAIPCGKAYDFIFKYNEF